MKAILTVITSLTAITLSDGLWAQSTTLEQQAEPAVSREHAEQIALRHVPGRVEEVDQDTWNGELMWEITIESEDGEDYEAHIHPENGRIVEVDS